MTENSSNKIVCLSHTAIVSPSLSLVVWALLVLCLDLPSYAQETRQVATGGGQRDLVQSAEFRTPRHSISTPVSGANYIAPNDSQYSSRQSRLSGQESGFLARVDARQSQKLDAGESSAGNQAAGETAGKTPLPPPSESDSGSTGRGSTGGFLSMLFSLAVVVGLFLGCVWVYRKFFGNIAQAGATNDPLKILARKTLGPRHQLAVIEFGPKVLLVSMQQGDTRTLSEIDDPVEVSRWKEQVAPQQSPNSGLLASFGMAAGQSKAAETTRNSIEPQSHSATLAGARLDSPAASASKKSFRAMLQDGVSTR